MNGLSYGLDNWVYGANGLLGGVIHGKANGKDVDIRGRIAKDFARYGREWCPHTATGMRVYRELPETERTRRDWAVVATAHAAKFDSIVEPLLGIRIPPPPELTALLSRPARHDTIAAELPALASRL